MITYLKGDATKPISPVPNSIRCICHIVNNEGGWGRGFVLSISKRWPLPERMYRYWASSPQPAQPFELGQIQIAQVEPDIIVVNMLAQSGYLRHNEPPPIRYEALRACLKTLHNYIKLNTSCPISVHMPRIGCGLAGGRWDWIELIILEELKAIPVYVYDL